MKETLTEEEQIVYEWQNGKLGGFRTALMNAIMRADSYNLKLLSISFPLEVSAFLRFSTEYGWWDSVMQKLYKM